MSQTSPRNFRHLSNSGPCSGFTWLPWDVSVTPRVSELRSFSFHPQMLKILAYFLGPRYTFRSPSVVGLNHRDSGFVWWQVQDHNQEYPQAAPVRSHSLHKKRFSPGMHALTHGATVLSMEGRYLHFTLLKLTQPHLIPETKWTRERSVSTPPGSVGMIQFHVGKRREGIIISQSPGVRSSVLSFIHASLPTDPWILQTHTAFVFTAFSSWGILWQASVRYLA